MELFLKSKVKIEKYKLGWIKDLKSNYGIQMKCAQCNNAGEIENFKWVCKEDRMGIDFEHTAHGTHQQNASL